MKKVILIGGAPTVGKSELAKKLAIKLNCPYISTDLIRVLMRSVVKNKDYPGLFYFKNQNPEIYLKNTSPKKIVQDQNKESAEVWKWIKSLIKKEIFWESESIIIEGVAILQHLIHKDFSKNKNIRSIFILNDYEKIIRKIIFKRGLWDDAKKYSDELKEKEVEWVICFNSWLEKQVKKYGYLTIESNGDKNSLSKIIKLCK